LPGLCERAEIAIGDLRDPSSLSRAAEGIDTVFHAAGHVLDWGRAADFEDANVRGTERLFEAAEAAKVRRFVHFSSIAVFGTPSPSYFDDDTPLGVGHDLYTRTKIEGEKVASRFAARGTEVVVLRPAVVYGPRGTWLEEPLAMIKKGKMVLLGGGAGTCHPCYVENLVDASLLAAEHTAAAGRAYIVGDDDPISFRDYFAGIALIAGLPPVKGSIPVSVARAAAGAMEFGARAVRSASRPLLTQTAIDMVTTKSTMSMGRIKTELGFRPRYDFKAAVNELRAVYAERG
jgi:nucleoside-diphosphate-sugar epimerase